MKVRDFRKEDLALMKKWLEQDYIRNYLGEPQEWLDEISENLNADWVKYFIAESDNPIGFGQYYETWKAPIGEWSSEPIGTVGIDYFIGDKAYLGKGLGLKLVRLLVEHIKSLNKYDYIIADPVPENKASIKVLEDNGFKPSMNGLYGLGLLNTELKVYRATKSDIKMITDLFRDTIQNINSRDYSKEETDDWSSWSNDHDKWEQKISEQYFIIARIGDILVGFSSLTTDGYLDFMFTHKDFQNQGIAGNLLQKIENKAREQGNTVIYSDVSITAKGFFGKHGFMTEKQQLKKSKQKELINFRMTKAIYGSSLQSL